MTGVIGIDEVGRGPLAGPVTVCACFITDEKLVLEALFHNLVRDSKRITKSLRYNIYQTIRQNRKINSVVKFAVASRSAEYIDRHGIVPAVRSCVRTCIQELRKKGVVVETCIIRLDAGLKIPEDSLKQESFIKGDEKYVEIALASIIAKVRRDEYMTKLSKQLPLYGWENNAGYGTKEHRKAIQKHGISKYHRTSYLKGFKLLDNLE